MRGTWRVFSGLMLAAAIGVTAWQTRAADDTAAPANAYDPSQGFVVHEWGAIWFGDVQNNLPDFVYLPSADELQETETILKPVLYFYPGNTTEADVSITLRGCTATSWYPQITRHFATEGEHAVSPPAFLHWPQCRFNAAGAMPPRVAEDHWWAACRDVDAALLTAGAEHEKFLYYETTKPWPARVAIVPDLERGTFAIANRGERAVDRILVLSPDAPCYRVEKNLAAGESRPFQPMDPDVKKGDVAAVAEIELRTWLLEAGLYDKEIEACVASWRETLLQSPGWRAVYLLPESEWNRVSELSIKPAPKSIKRVTLVVSSIEREK